MRPTQASLALRPFLDLLIQALGTRYGLMVSTPDIPAFQRRFYAARQHLTAYGQPAAEGLSLRQVEDQPGHLAIVKIGGETPDG